MEIAETIDLAAIETRLKFSVIIKNFDALLPGQVLVVFNDADSMPFYRLLVKERGETFGWEMLENGPGRWKTKIIKNEEDTIGNIIARDYRKSTALTNLGIDFSCDGNRTIEQAFAGKEHYLKGVLLEWKAIDQLSDRADLDLGGWDMASLTNYIIQLHHKFVSTQTAFITELAFKVAESNHSRNPEIKEIAYLFAETGSLLEQKSIKEEQELFPLITALSQVEKSENALKIADYGQIDATIALLQTGSLKIVEGMRQIRDLTRNYIAPAYTSSTCPILYKLLAAYEEDALLHLHLENNILFPKAVKTVNILHSKNNSF
jgi:regulator of cell morphogenesis and NO signaling